MRAEKMKERSGKEGRGEEITKKIKLETIRNMSMNKVCANIRRPKFLIAEDMEVFRARQ
jgi:hypothetical protein